MPKESKEKKVFGVIRLDFMVVIKNRELYKNNIDSLKFTNDELVKTIDAISGFIPELNISGVYLSCTNGLFSVPEMTLLKVKDQLEYLSLQGAKEASQVGTKGVLITPIDYIDYISPAELFHKYGESLRSSFYIFPFMAIVEKETIQALTEEISLSMQGEDHLTKMVEFSRTLPIFSRISDLVPDPFISIIPPWTNLQAVVRTRLKVERKLEGRY